LIFDTIKAQLRPGEGSQLVGLVAVVDAENTAAAAGRISLKIAGSLVGDALTRQALGDRSHDDGGRWGEPLPARDTRGARLESLMGQVDTLMPKKDRDLALHAARLHGDHAFTTRGLLRGQLPGARELSAVKEVKLREILLGVSERFDGDGSPRGLGGEAIPISARLLAIIDCWDWLTTSRAFAPRLVRNEARAAIFAEAGARLDPELVEPFLELV